MPTDDWSALLQTIEAGMWAGLIYPDHVPRIAAELLADGYDSPALRDLAGADLEPTDPRDFRDAFLRLLDEQHIEDPTPEDRTQLASHLLAQAVRAGGLSLREGVHRASRLTIAAGYPRGPLMTLYGLDDEWGEGWGRGEQVVEREARRSFDELGEGAPLVPAVVIQALLVSR